MIYLGRQTASLNAIKTVEKTVLVNRSAVNFIDYNGMVLSSYTAAEAAALTAMPSLPLHEGLSAQGWNYTLEQMKSCLSAVGTCDIGCMYTTFDGKTRITLTIQDAKYSEIPLVFQQTVANGVQVDWGDRSAAQTYSDTSQLTATHQYSPQSYPATYTVTFNVVNGMMSFPANIMGKSGTQSATNPFAIWTNMIDSVRIGNGVTSIGDYAFQNCYSLTSITIPNSVTSIGQYAFEYCRSLASITIPSLVTSIGIYTFRYCSSFTLITIPSLVTSIGNYAFSGCYSSASITIPNTVTSIGTYAFQNCYSIASITIPNTVTSIDNYAFSGCYSSASITIPNTVTSIGTYAFQNCYSIASITIPSSITNINNNTFGNCYGIKTFDFRTATAVPQLGNVNAFGNTPSDKEIIVPDELYDTWKAATNWKSTTNNIVNCIVKASESSLGPLS